MWMLALAFHVGLVLVAYRVGRDSAGPGIAVFFAGVILFQLFVSGPASFIGGDCYTDWDGRSNPTVCD